MPCGIVRHVDQPFLTSNRSPRLTEINKISTLSDSVSQSVESSFADIVKNSKLSIIDNNNRQLNHIIRGIPDTTKLDELIPSLFKDILHCQPPKTFYRLGAINSKYEVSRRLIKVSYNTINAKQSVTDNLRFLKDSEYSEIQFSDDHNPEQLKEISEMKSLAKSKNDDNDDDGVYFCVRGTPSKNLRIIKKTKKPIIHSTNSHCP